MHRLPLLIAAAALGAGCTQNPTFEDARYSELTLSSYEAADRLLASSQRMLLPELPVVVSSLSRLESPSQSSNLGRLVAEQIGSRLTQRGIVVPAPGARRLTPVGETPPQPVQAFVVGTYATGSQYIYVSVKLVEAASQRTISAYDYMLPYAGQVKALADQR